MCCRADGRTTTTCRSRTPVGAGSSVLSMLLSLPRSPLYVAMTLKKGGGGSLVTLARCDAVTSQTSPALTGTDVFSSQGSCSEVTPPYPHPPRRTCRRGGARHVDMSSVRSDKPPPPRPLRAQGSSRHGPGRLHPDENQEDPGDERGQKRDLPSQEQASAVGRNGESGSWLPFVSLSASILYFPLLSLVPSPHRHSASEFSAAQVDRRPLREVGCVKAGSMLIVIICSFLDREIDVCGDRVQKHSQRRIVLSPSITKACDHTSKTHVRFGRGKKRLSFLFVAYNNTVLQHTVT